MDHRQRLRELLIERSLTRGEFTLASGRRSTYYVDARRTTMSAEGQLLTGKLGLEALLANGLEPSHIGGLTMGADPVAYAIAHTSALQQDVEASSGYPVINAFSVRKQAKGHGTGRRVEGADLSGARVVITEDSTTTGGSALKAIAAVEEVGATVLAVLTVVDREEGAREKLAEAGYPFVALFPASELLG